MKVIYCASSINIDDLKMIPGNYTSSKINTLFRKSKPFFIREFDTISNIEYIDVQDYPDFYQIWNDMMNKITFAYNYKYLESKVLYDEYLEFNKKMAGKINEICNNNDLVIVNDASLYLLPEMVRCKVAIRNLDFDECFIERVPYYKNILRGLMKAEKFFSSETGLRAFHRYIDSSYEFADTDKGGCHHLLVHVDKEAVLDMLNVCSVYRNALASPRLNIDNDTVEHLQGLTIPKNMPVLMTNVPLLHLEGYIKAHPKINVRYIRSSVEIDDKQDRMVQYLKKAYGCTVDVIDKHDYSIIALEMFYCDVFVGYKYFELAKLLRKPYVEDNNDPERMMANIKAVMGRMQGRQAVFGEDQYLREFMELNGYDALQDSDSPIDDKIDSYVLELMGWISKHHTGGPESSQHHGESSQHGAARGSAGLSPENSSVSGSFLGVASAFRDRMVGQLNERQDGAADAAGPQAIYRKTVNGESVYYRKRSEIRPALPSRQDENRAHPPAACACGRRESACTCSSGKPRHNKVEEHPGAGAANPEDPSPAARHSTKVKRVPEHANVDKIMAAWRASNRIALLDYDGTLSKIQPLPHLAKPDEGLFELLRKFNRKNKCIICTGRSTSVVDEWFPAEFEIFAEHGACFRKDGIWTENSRIDGIDECVELMEYYHIRTPGTVLERKGFGCAFHFKQAKYFNVEKLFYLLRRIVGNAVALGKGVIEVRSSNKFDIARKVKPALVAGDDHVDEDMYEACDGISIRVGEGETKAEWYVNTVADFRGLLEKLSE